MIKKIVFFLLAPIVAFNVMAAEVLMADYVQVKTLKVFGASIQSSGNVLVTESEGIVWNQLNPVAVKTRIDESSVTTLAEGGVVNRLELKNVTEASAIPALLKALLQGKDEQMVRYFSLRMRDKRNQAEILVLEPTDEFLKRLFSEIEVRRTRTLIEGVSFLDGSGDSTKIQFSNVRTQSVNANELRTLFDLK